jgi:hypothetical protein
VAPRAVRRPACSTLGAVRTAASATSRIGTVMKLARGFRYYGTGRAMPNSSSWLPLDYLDFAQDQPCSHPLAPAKR